MKKFLSLSLVLGCAINHKDLPPGGAGGQCYPNGTCNTGLSCQEGYCFAPPDAGPGGPDSSTDSSTPYACNDDSAYESNNDPGTSYALPTTATTVLTKLAICPANDVDYYRLTLPGLRSLDAQVDYDGAATPLKVTILNVQNAPLAEGVKVMNLDSVRATAANLPAGTYLVRVRSDGTGVGNYNISTSLRQ